MPDLALPSHSRAREATARVPIQTGDDARPLHKSRGQELGVRPIQAGGASSPSSIEHGVGRPNASDQARQSALPAALPSQSATEKRPVNRPNFARSGTPEPVDVRQRPMDSGRTLRITRPTEALTAEPTPGKSGHLEAAMTRQPGNEGQARVAWTVETKTPDNPLPDHAARPLRPVSADLLAQQVAQSKVVGASPELERLSTAGAPMSEIDTDEPQPDAVNLASVNRPRHASLGLAETPGKPMAPTSKDLSEVRSTSAPVEVERQIAAPARDQTDFSDRITRFAALSLEGPTQKDTVMAAPREIEGENRLMAPPKGALETADAPKPMVAAPRIGPDQTRPTAQFAVVAPMPETQALPMADPATASREPGLQGGPPPHAAQAMARDIAQQLAPVLRAVPREFTEITLRPDELGRVQMRMSGQDGQILLQVVAERPETQDLMRRHIDVVERAFRELGYTDIAFEFSTSGQQKRRPGPETPLPEADITGDPAEETPPEAQSEPARTATTRLDIRV
ncbi:flagellar hook-length control protein FliK [Marinovum sp.]|uniref:flagellar hook-length control protein FliK n=1 Tax=Marinovum sp. TaxID=2024839 RepID=UPI003A9399B4